MSRRRFLQASALLGAGAGMGGFAVTERMLMMFRKEQNVTRELTEPHGEPTEER